MKPRRRSPATIRTVALPAVCLALLTLGCSSSENARSTSGAEDASIDSGSDAGWSDACDSSAHHDAPDVSAETIPDTGAGVDTFDEDAGVDAFDEDAGVDAFDGDAGGGDSGDECQPHWQDSSTCDCSPTSCAPCSSVLQQSDGCGHTRDVPCQVPPSGCPSGQVCGAQGDCVIRVQNPVLAIDGPDPDVLRVVGAGGTVTYYLVHTVHNSGDIPVYSSPDLIHWTKLSVGALARTRQPGSSLEINGTHYCSIWAPDLTRISSNIFMLGFSATRFSSTQPSCPGYAEDGGVYLVSSATVTGPYATTDHPWEPLPAGAHQTNCAASVRDQVPHSLTEASRNCQGNYCHKIVRLDSDAFHDPVTGRWWMTYSWFTNSPPLNDWERNNHGEHLSITELDPSDPFTVKCDVDVPQIHAANPHDGTTKQRLATYCPRCAEMLSFTKGRYGKEFTRDGYSWGVTEGGNLFRRGAYVYLMVSGSLWDSAYYHVYWTAAKTVEELVYTNQSRLVGRYLVPSKGQAFGHGTAVLGPDGIHWYYVHHRLRSNQCSSSGDCKRDIWVSPMEFEDRGDGLGDVYLKARFPAEQPSVEVWP